MTTWSDATTPPRVIIRDDRGSSRTWADTRSDFGVTSCTVIEGAWEGPGGLEIHGLLLVPSAELAAAYNGGVFVARSFTAA